MRLGAAAWGFREIQLEEELRLCQEMGVTDLEISIAGGENDRLQLGATQAEVEAVMALAAEAGIGIEYSSGSCGFTSENPQENQESLTKLRQIIDISAMLKVKAIRIFAGFSPLAEVTGARWEMMIDCLRKAAEHAQKVNLELAIETHGGIDPTPPGVRHFLSTSTDPEALAKMLDALPGNVGINFDPANLKAVGNKDIPGFLDQFLPRVNYLHFKDFRFIDNTNHVDPVACGDDDLDWEPLLTRLASFSGPAFIEYEVPADVAEGLRRSVEYLTPLLEKNGLLNTAVK